MKKFLVAVMAVVMAVLAMSLVACSIDVNGKTFVYDSLQIISGEVSEETKAEIEAGARAGNEKVTFNKDGTITVEMQGKSFVAGNWEQKDGKVIVKAGTQIEAEFIIDGEKLYIEETSTYDNNEVTFRIYVKVANLK